MTKKGKKIFLLFSYLGLLLVCGILRTVFSGNEFVANIFAWLFISLFLLGAIFMFALIFVVRNKDKKLMQSFIDNKDYITAKKVFESKEASYLAYGSKIVARYYILISCFALNDIETARELLSTTNWKGGWSIAVKYYEILLNLKDNKLEFAKNNYDILTKKAKKINATHVNKVKQIFTCIGSNNFDDKFYSDSVNPIVKEIYDFYSSQNIIKSND